MQQNHTRQKAIIEMRSLIPAWVWPGKRLPAKYGNKFPSHLKDKNNHVPAIYYTFSFFFPLCEHKSTSRISSVIILSSSPQLQRPLVLSTGIFSFRLGLGGEATRTLPPGSGFGQIDNRFPAPLSGGGLHLVTADSPFRFSFLFCFF